MPLTPASDFHEDTRDCTIRTDSGISCISSENLMLGNGVTRNDDFLFVPTDDISPDHLCGVPGWNFGTSGKGHHQVGFDQLGLQVRTLLGHGAQGQENESLFIPPDDLGHSLSKIVELTAMPAFHFGAPSLVPEQRILPNPMFEQPRKNSSS